MQKQSMALGFTRSTLALAIATALTFSTATHAQEQASLEEITVTGSRIRQTDGMTTPIPVTTLTTTELSSFEPGGTIAEQLDALPQFFGTQTAQRTGAALVGPTGGSFLNMRSLGANRTLVLLDGSRVVPAAKSGSVNVDTFPTALIRSVDVVTGGASAAYGADALGGVTNFILDREFEGLKIQSGTGITEWGDGQRWNFSIAGGKQFGERLNVIGSLQAMEIKQIQRDPEDLDADWFQRWGWVTNPEWSPGAAPGTPQRLTLPWVASSEHSPTGVIWARNGNNSNSPLLPFDFNGQTFLEDGSATRPFIHGDVYAAPNAPGSTKSMSGGPEAQVQNRAYNGGPSGAEVAGRSAFLASRYEFNDSLSGFAQIMIGRSESSEYRDRGYYTLSDGWFATIYRNNAFLPEDIGAAMDAAGIDSFQLHKQGSFRESEDILDQREDHNVFTTYSWSVGFDAVLPNGWDLRASWQSGQADKMSGVYPNLRIDRMFLAMDAVRDPATGAIVCNVQLYNPTEAELAESVAGRESPLGGPLLSPIGLDNTVRDCVPFNIMGSGHVPRSANDYMATPKIGRSTVDQDFAEVLVTGELVEGWSGPITMAAGLTYREQSFSDIALPYDVSSLGPPLNAEHLGIRGIAPSYTGGSPNLHSFATVPTIDGAYDVWEWFSELNIPVWQSTSGAQHVDGSVAYRSSDYSSTGRIESWKLGLDVQLLEGLRFRATKSRDVREATFSERFDEQGSNGAVTDPRFNNSNFQITSVIGGNRDLRPEVADTVVAGVVYQPAWLEGLQVSTDWYEVKIKDAVSSLGLQRIVDECELNGVQSLCAMIERDPVSGIIGRVHNVFLNVAQAKVEGVDFEASYRTEMDLFDDQSESLNIRTLAGYIMERSDTPLGGEPFDTAGSLGTPEFTATVTANYTIGAYSFQLQERFIDATLLNSRWVEGVDVDDNTVSSSAWTNARVGYTGETSNGGTWEVALNVQNLFDRNPPVIPSFTTRGSSQAINNDYDIYGRRYQLSFNVNF